MKKTIQILFFSALSVAGFSQSKTGSVVNAKDLRKESREISDYEKNRRSTPKPIVENSSNRDDFFYENFNNGFSGNNGAGTWTTSHMLTGVPSTQGSMWSDNGSPAFEHIDYGADAVLASATPDRYVIWDGAQYANDWPNSLPVVQSSYTAFLNAPTLDFSALSTVQVEFYQLFSWGYRFEPCPMTVDVRVGNGEWTSFNAAPGEFVYSVTITDNPLKSVVDISCVAAGQSNVQIRFAFNSAQEWGQDGLFWCIDDVRIYDNTTENDLKISAITNGDITTGFEYRATPMEQRIPEADGGVSVGAIFENVGTETIENAHFKIEFYSGANLAHEYLSDEFTIYSMYDQANPELTCPSDTGATQWRLYQTGFYPTTAGLYTLQVTLVLPDGTVDATPGNNTMSKEIRFTSNAEFGHDRDNLNWMAGSSPISGSGGQYHPNGWGGLFQCKQAGSVAHGVTVRFGQQTEVGVQFRVFLRQMTAGQSLDNGTEVGLGLYDTRAGWNTGAPLYFAFNDPNVFTDPKPALPYGPIPTDVTLFAAIQRPEPGAGNFGVFFADNEDDHDRSCFQYQRMTNTSGESFSDWMYTYDMAPAVRLVLSNQNHVPIAVEETETPLAGFLVYPNPAVNEARVSFNLTESSYIAYEVRDLQGRLMDTDNVGRFSTGENSFSLNVSKYPAGNYIVGLVVEGAQIFTQQISVVR